MIIRFDPIFYRREPVRLAAIVGGEVSWSTSGDGRFDDSDILQQSPSQFETLYYPGPNDLASESVDLCIGDLTVTIKFNS